MSLEVLTSQRAQPMLETRILDHEPHIAIGGIALRKHELVTINRIEFGTGVIQIDRETSAFSEEELEAVVLSSLGFDNHDMAYITRKSTHSLGQRAGTALRKIKDTSPDPVHSKLVFARYCFSEGIYTIKEPGMPLGLAEDDQDLIDCLSYGENDTMINRRRMLPPPKAGVRINALLGRTGLQKREHLVLGAFLSDEINL